MPRCLQAPFLCGGAVIVWKHSKAPIFSEQRKVQKLRVRTVNGFRRRHLANLMRKRRCAVATTSFKTAATLILALVFPCPGLTQGVRQGHTGAATARTDLVSAGLPTTMHSLPPRDLDPPWRGTRQGLSPGHWHAWLLLSLAQGSSAFFDAATTRDAVGHYQELDPLLRPFAHSAALYPVMQIAPVGLDWLAIRMAKSHDRWIRRIWWLPQTAAIVGFLWSGAHNLRLHAPAPR